MFLGLENVEQGLVILYLSMMSQYISMTTGKAVAGKEMKKVRVPLLSFRLGKDEMMVSVTAAMET